MIMTPAEGDLETFIRQSDHLGVIRYIRAHRLREPYLVIRHGQLLLGEQLELASAHSDKLLPHILPIGMDESECLGALEQICMAALETQNYIVAQTALSRIARSARSSVRCKRLQGLMLEAHNDIEGALLFYNDLIKENPSNYFAMKRKYCVLKANLRNVEARDILNQYLEKNGADLGAWMEMASTCLDAGDYAGAAFCYEELILANPLDSDLHCLLAECYITAGGKDHLKLARKHMAQSLELNPKNIRAMYGLIAAAEAYLETMSLTQTRSKANVETKAFEEEDMEVARELIRYGADELVKAYQNSPLSALVQSLVQNIQSNLD